MKIIFTECDFCGFTSHGESETLSWKKCISCDGDFCQDCIKYISNDDENVKTGWYCENCFEHFQRICSKCGKRGAARIVKIKDFLKYKSTDLICDECVEKDHDTYIQHLP